jgi:ABC-type branched-subunit amino acid transport system ATPase component
VLEILEVIAGPGDTAALREAVPAVPRPKASARPGPDGAGGSTLVAVASGSEGPMSGRNVLLEVGA